MFKHKDFAPNRISKGNLISSATYESLKEVEAVARDWIRQNGFKVINVETIILPAFHPDDGVEVDSEFSVWELNPNYRHPTAQIIRVWYDDGT